MSGIKLTPNPNFYNVAPIALELGKLAYRLRNAPHSTEPGIVNAIAFVDKAVDEIESFLNQEEELKDETEEN
jgi:hypothetical protein